MFRVIAVLSLAAHLAVETIEPDAPNAPRYQEHRSGYQDARHLIESSMHAERHEDQKKWEHVQEMARAELRRR